jgi:hypothetical protein
MADLPLAAHLAGGPQELEQLLSQSQDQAERQKLERLLDTRDPGSVKHTLKLLRDRRSGKTPPGYRAGFHRRQREQRAGGRQR